MWSREIAFKTCKNSNFRLDFLEYFSSIQFIRALKITAFCRHSNDGVSTVENSWLSRHCRRQSVDNSSIFYRLDETWPCCASALGSTRWTSTISVSKKSHLPMPRQISSWAISPSPSVPGIYLPLRLQAFGGKNFHIFRVTNYKP